MTGLEMARAILHYVVGFVCLFESLRQLSKDEFYRFLVMVGMSLLLAATAH